MIRFILNENEQAVLLPPGVLLLDYIRYHQHLTGTKIGCREGDCGACTVLVGELQNNEVTYRSVTSCLTPLANVDGKHVVTIEGLNMNALNPVQQAIADCSATQCGFCTPGFVVSLAGFCLSKKEATLQNAIASIDGNICRCTGYKSIEKAAGQVAAMMAGKGAEEPAQFVARTQLLPAYFTDVKQRLQALLQQTNGKPQQRSQTPALVGGGTDLYVQKPEEMQTADVRPLSANLALKSITVEDGKCTLGAAVTVTDLQESAIMQQHFPNLQKMMGLVSSTPIRNMATISGNFINASPIGDLTIFFLALDALLTLSDGETLRQMPLRKIYKGYKTLDKKPGEWIVSIAFELPSKTTLVNFEKVSKRTHLDIASVNTALVLSTESNTIKKAGLSAGGVGPVPLFLEKTSTFLKGMEITEFCINEAIKIAQTEISPIGDARGSEAYKRLLLTQLIKAHFIEMFPHLKTETLLQASKAI